MSDQATHKDLIIGIIGSENLHTGDVVAGYRPDSDVLLVGKIEFKKFTPHGKEHPVFHYKQDNVEWESGLELFSAIILIHCTQRKRRPLKIIGELL